MTIDSRLDLVLERIVDVPPELVWAAWTEPEQLKRWFTPAPWTTVDCEIAGHQIRRGTVVGMLLGAANRDPARFADPDRLDLGRQDNHHVSFGYGAHFCLGAALARVEGQIVIASLLRRFPDLDGERNPTLWKRSLVLRGPTALHVHW